jgi:hypothetical protein
MALDHDPHILPSKQVLFLLNHTVFINSGNNEMMADIRTVVYLIYPVSIYPFILQIWTPALYQGLCLALMIKS